MKIAICDDEPKRITEVKDALINYFSEKVIATEIFCFEDGNKLLNSNVYFDMAFLDIEMPSINGVEVGKKLKQKSNNIVIFMITAYSEYLDDAFDLGAYRFLQKPLDVTRLYRSLDAALLTMSCKNVKIICPNNESVIIPTNSIIFCESYKRKTKIVTTQGEYLSKEHIDFWKEKLSELNFYSPHTSYIINFNFVKSFTRKTLTLTFEEKSFIVSVAPKRQQEFRTKMFLFAERGM